MSCKGSFLISIVLAFSCGQAKTIRIRYVWRPICFENGEKTSISENPDTCGQGPNQSQSTSFPGLGKKADLGKRMNSPFPASFYVKRFVLFFFF